MPRMPHIFHQEEYAAALVWAHVLNGSFFSITYQFASDTGLSQWNQQGMTSDILILCQYYLLLDHSLFFILEKSFSSPGISVSSHEKYVFEGEVSKMLKPLPLLFSWFLQTLPCNCAEVVLHLIQDFVRLTEISLVFHPAFFYSNKQSEDCCCWNMYTFC